MIWAWCWHDKTHRVLIYIAVVATATLLVQLLGIDVVGE